MPTRNDEGDLVCTREEYAEIPQRRIDAEATAKCQHCSFLLAELDRPERLAVQISPNGWTRMVITHGHVTSDACQECYDPDPAGEHRRLFGPIVCPEPFGHDDVPCGTPEPEMCANCGVVPATLTTPWCTPCNQILEPQWEDQ